jgi:hypothetical protein
MSWEDVWAMPEGLYLVCLWTMVYVLVTPLLVRTTRKLKAQFLDEYIFDYDETFNQEELGAVVLSVNQLLKWQGDAAALATEHLRITEKTTKKSSRKKIFERKWESIHLSIGVDVSSDPTNTDISVHVGVGGIHKKFPWSEVDLCIGLMVKGKKGDWIPYARTEIAINQTAWSFRRLFIIPGEDPDREFAFVVFNHKCHFGVQEMVQ